MTKSFRIWLARLRAACAQRDYDYHASNAVWHQKRAAAAHLDLLHARSALAKIDSPAKALMMVKGGKR